VRSIRRLLLVIVGLFVLILVVWSVAIGPVAAYRVFTHGTTTVWDHLEYPGRELSPSSSPQPWPVAADSPIPPAVLVDGTRFALAALLADTESLALVVVHDGDLLYEWYAADHGPDRPSMVFSVTKSIFSLLIGAAVDDGLIGSVDDSVTLYVPELRDAGFDAVSLRDLLRMDSGLDYVESDNPFGKHVKFNYTDDLTSDILALRLRDAPDASFRYKSGDYALLALALDRALGEATITGYLQERLWESLGMETGGVWSTDTEDGLERNWCCLAMTARDLARFGQLALDDGLWEGERLVSSQWLQASYQPAYEADRWPLDYAESPLVSYGYGWWLTGDAWVALGKDGQYLYIDPARDTVIVRLGESQGDIGWVDILRQVAESTDQ
jgi:CubicO group peptidase (beta-lactamase class C family)